MSTAFDDDVPLFHLEQARITPEHIDALWHVISMPGHPDEDTHKAEALRLANQDVETAAEYIVGLHPASYATAELGAYYRAKGVVPLLVELTVSYLRDPEALPKMVKVPTFEDCVRLADTGTEAGRALAWLLGIWPNTLAPLPAAIGDTGMEPGSQWVSLMGDHISVHTRLEKHPYAEKQVFQFQHQVHPSQLVGTARWLLAQAGEQA